MRDFICIICKVCFLHVALERKEGKKIVVKNLNKKNKLIYILILLQVCRNCYLNYWTMLPKYILQKYVIL